MKRVITAVAVVLFIALGCGDYAVRDEPEAKASEEVPPKIKLSKPEPSSDEIENALLSGCVNEQLRIAGNGADPYNPNRWEIYCEGDGSLYYTVLDRNAVWMVSNELFEGKPIILAVNETSRRLTPHLPIPDGYDPAKEMTYPNLILYLGYKSSVKK